MTGGSGSGSGSETSSETSSDTSSYSCHTVFPTPTNTVLVNMDDREGETALVTASLAMAVMALLFALVVTVIVAVMLYFIVKLRKEVKSLRYSGGRGGAVAKAENGSSHLVAVNILSDSLPNTDTGDESLDRKPTPLPPPVQTVTTPDQTILKPPPGDQNQEDHTAPARVNSPRDAYDNINLKTSILPPELRTEENLEGRLLDLAEVRLLEEAERRKEESYEDIEMSLRRKEEAVQP
ncbi:hypothetical protein GBAR_LOCUS25182 [Geodia barretti]|uniref:Uncharacterized protein n=1 Tax=Geodia barretti TaxID=519541 RepID=A0AA35TCR2_GEOBA|nr:hypothetical protein GBAR_LOCUS25182 [Geodia barretti]